MERITALLHRDQPVRWVFAGDSITHGAAHTGGWRDYTELFSERVRWELGRPRDIVIKTGISGWTVEALANDLDANVLSFAPDGVSMMFGMNDCAQGMDGLQAFRDRYRTAIETIRARTGAEVLIHTPNAVIPPAAEARIAYLPAYREAILDLASELDLPVIDHFVVWSSPEFASTVHHWLPDGFHPNEFGHRVLARVLFQALDLWDDASPVCRLPIRPAST